MSVADTVRAMFTAYEAEGVDGALRHFATDAVLVVGPESSAEPDTYEGAAGAERYFGGFEGALDDVRFELVDVHEELGHAAICAVKLSGVGAATRIPVEQDVLMTFAASDGLLTRIVAHPTMESARAEVSRE